MVRIFGLDTLSSSPLLVVFKVFSSCPGRGNRLAYGKGCRHQSRWWWKDSSPTMSLGSIPRHLFHRRPHTGLSTRTLVPLSTVSTLVPSRLCSTLTTHAVMLHPLSLLWSGVTTPRSSIGEALLPVYTSVKEAVAKHPDAGVVKSTRALLSV